jgi:hypothetical protein
MEIPAKTGGNSPSSSRKGWSWRVWLLILLFPIPFGPCDDAKRIWLSVM